ncbi:MAG: SRPBCC family protein [Longimicrobiales bacterium]
MTTKVETTEDRLEIEIRIQATPAKVFAALTDPAQVTRWWGDPEAYQTTDAEVDLRVGGRYKFSGRNTDGSAFWVGGEYREVDAPRRLVYTWEPNWDPAMQGDPTVVEITLEPKEGGTTLRVVHRGFERYAEQVGGYHEGWERVLGWLRRHVEN